MIVRALEKETDLFRPCQEGEEVLGFEYPDLSAIGALKYLANNTRPDIAFVIKLVVRFSVAPTMRHWNKVVNVLRYLQGTPDLGLFYKKNQDLSLINLTNFMFLLEGLSFHRSLVNRL
jgi:hypothetical protein